MACIFDEPLETYICEADWNYEYYRLKREKDAEN